MILVINNGSRYLRTLIVHLREFRVKFRISDYYNTLPKFSRYNGIIITGGREFVQERYDFIENIIKNTDIAVLGICLGHNYIAEIFGGKSEYSIKGREKRYDVSVIKQNELTKGLKKLNDMECHSHKIVELPKNFERLGASMYSKYDIIKHKNKNIYGVQFHPESNDDGRIILKNFLKDICKEN